MISSAPIVKNDTNSDGHRHGTHQHVHDGHPQHDDHGHASHDHPAARSISLLNAPGLSLLRMSAVQRLCGAIGLTAILWVAVLWTLQPA